MTLTITKGMDGKTVETIGKYSAKEINKMNSDFEKWKKLKKTLSKYKIDYYQRIIFREDEQKLIVDFGDYSYFARVKANKSEWRAIKEHMAKPRNLDV